MESDPSTWDMVLQVLDKLIYLVTLIVTALWGASKTRRHAAEAESDRKGDLLDGIARAKLNERLQPLERIKEAADDDSDNAVEDMSEDDALNLVLEGLELGDIEHHEDDEATAAVLKDHVKKVKGAKNVRKTVNIAGKVGNVLLKIVKVVT